MKTPSDSGDSASNGKVSTRANREEERVLGKAVTNEERKCPMCGSTTWILLDGISTLQALEGGLQAVAYSCEECGFMRWHRADKADRA
jgi:predicted RNA-binding Zn-ribbon protein involved in translation (DUF1610 family)